MPDMRADLYHLGAISELSSSLTLVFAVAPGWCVKECLQLIRAYLPANRETFFHRVDRLGTDLTFFLRQAISPQPIVLVHGLEWLPTSEEVVRAEESLNVARDGLRAFRAVIVIAIPEEESQRFFIKCADLFHWHAAVISFSDADSPAPLEGRLQREWLHEVVVSLQHRRLESPVYQPALESIFLEPRVMPDRGKTDSVLVSDWSEKYPRTILYGSRYLGKTAALEFLMARMAQEATDDPISKPLPVCIQGFELAVRLADLPKRDMSLSELLLSNSRREDVNLQTARAQVWWTCMRTWGSHLGASSSSRPIALFLDGCDIASLHTYLLRARTPRHVSEDKSAPALARVFHGFIIEWLQTIAQVEPSLQIRVSSVYPLAINNAGWQQAKVESWNVDQRRQFARSYFAAFRRNQQVKEVDYERPERGLLKDSSIFRRVSISDIRLMVAAFFPKGWHRASHRVLQRISDLVVLEWDPQLSLQKRIGVWRTCGIVALAKAIAERLARSRVEDFSFEEIRDLLLLHWAEPNGQLRLFGAREAISTLLAETGLLVQRGEDRYVFADVVLRDYLAFGQVDAHSVDIE